MEKKSKVENYKGLIERIVSGFNSSFVPLPHAREYYIATLEKAAELALADFDPKSVPEPAINPNDSQKERTKKIERKILVFEKRFVETRLRSMFCKLGKRIDDNRINKYEPFVRSIVPKYISSCALFEGSMNEKDLWNECRIEVMMALRDSFDPNKAMLSYSKTIKSASEGKKRVEEKLKNPEETLEAAEKRSVYSRLKNYLCRTRHRYSPKFLGGRSISYDGILQENHVEPTSNEVGGVYAVNELAVNDVERDQSASEYIQSLIEAMEQGLDVKHIYEMLPASQKESISDALFSGRISGDVVETADSEETETTESSEEDGSEGGEAASQELAAEEESQEAEA
jgi:hypothetical protein